MINVSYLVCPKDNSKLSMHDNVLICNSGHKFPIIEGIPVLLNDEATDKTMSLLNYSWLRANGKYIDDRCPELYLETLGVGEKEKEMAINLFRKGHYAIDPVVSVMLLATSGYLYKDILGKVEEYPIPELRLQPGNSKLLVDVGCNWGRWSIAAARKGYNVVGIDPSLGAVLAAKRVSEKLGLSISFVCGDARFMPFADNIFDYAFSYSVLQHFSKINVENSLIEIKRILKKNGISFIQMANKFGIRSLQHQVKRKFREPINFEVRYWSPNELMHKFKEIIGPSKLSVDGYFGLGIQKNDIHLLPLKSKIIICASEIIRNTSKVLIPLKYVADSLYVKSTKIK